MAWDPSWPAPEGVGPRILSMAIAMYAEIDGIEAEASGDAQVRQDADAYDFTWISGCAMALARAEEAHLARVPGDGSGTSGREKPGREASRD